MIETIQNKQQVVISTSHIEHPDWNSFTLSGDVAILYLDSPLTVSEFHISYGNHPLVLQI